MYQALYRAYRPEVFEEILGQEHIVRILKNQIKSNTTSHAYLFCGTRGTGKTTIARILAKGLNCLDEGEGPCGKCANCQAIKNGSFIDVIEIDAASNTGVDSIRELRESVNYPPAVGRKKIYIIDEVHMLSSSAFNALLKTLEEPPEYVTFILATTEMQKLPATILSRCMRLDFKRVPENIIIRGMADICKKIDIDVSEDALRIIASNADGSVRDGLSILDQCISGGDKTISEENVLEFLGASGVEAFLELTDMVRKKRTSQAIAFVAEQLADGKDVRQFMRDWIGHYRNLLMVKYMRDPSSVVSLSAENIHRITRQAEVLELEDINRGILELSRLLDEARWSTQPRILLELGIVKLCMGAGELVKAVEAPAQAAPVKKVAPEDKPAVNKSVAEAPEAKTPEPDVVATDEPEAVEKEPEDVPTLETSEDVPAPETPEDMPAPPETVEAVDESDFDLDELWNNVFEAGEAEFGSFYIIGSGAKLTSIEENVFNVVVNNEVTKGHTNNNRKIIEDLMEKYTGKRRVMKILLDASKKADSKSAEEIAEDASDILGIKVDIE